MLVRPTICSCTSYKILLQNLQLFELFLPFRLQSGYLSRNIHSRAFDLHNINIKSLFLQESEELGDCFKINLALLKCESALSSLRLHSLYVGNAQCKSSNYILGQIMQVLGQCILCYKPITWLLVPFV